MFLPLCHTRVQISEVMGVKSALPAVTAIAMMLLLVVVLPAWISALVFPLLQVQ